jgi:hypothetical protein
VPHSRVRLPCMLINSAVSKRSTINGGRAQTCAINCRVSLRLFLYFVHVCHAVGVALWCAGLSDPDGSDGMRLKHQLAMVAPRAIEQR